LETAAISASTNQEYSEKDVSDVPFTPRVDDALDSLTAAQQDQDGPRSPLPGGVPPQARPILSQSQKDENNEFK